MSIRREEFVQWGFRWPEPTSVQVSASLSVLIVPSGYLKSRESWVATERGRKFLREYTLTFSDGARIDMLDELRVQLKIGEDPDA